jgi:cytochrome-b5 reductase
MFALTPYLEESMTQLLVFAMSFVSVFYGIQLTKYIASLYESSTKKKVKSTLPLDDFIPIPLIRKDVLSHDTVKFTFALPNPDEVLGLPTGQHVSLKYYMTETAEDGKTTTKTAVQRSYTPVTDNTKFGEFSLVIKVYRPLPPKFPHGGKMSQHLDSLRINDTILVHGPKGHTEYCGNGKITVKPLGKKVVEHRTSHHIAMMAGGTGITPMLQLLHHIFIADAKTDTKTQVHLIYANQTEDDILVRNELESLLVQFPTRFSLWYTIDRLNESSPDQSKKWNYDIGFINPTMIEKHLLFPKTVRDTQFVMCGPPPMIKFACLPALQSFGYTEKDWIIY